MRVGTQTDHEFELSPYCDCDSCNELCHFHYGLDDACLLERYEHAPPTAALMALKETHEAQR